MPSANFVFPVRYVSEGVAVQSTSRELSPLGIAVRSLAPPQVGARVSMALYLPNTSVPEVAIGRVAKAKSGATNTPHRAAYPGDHAPTECRLSDMIGRSRTRAHHRSGG